MKHRLFLSLVPALFSGAAAQQALWADGQINTTMCIWTQPRAALIRDSVYIDGGLLSWLPGYDNGTYGSSWFDGDFRRLVYSFNLSNPVNPETNVSKLLIDDAMGKFNDGLGSNFHDGAMLANDNQYILFGGLIQMYGGTKDPPDADEVLGYQFYRYGPERVFEPDWDSVNLGEDVNRYIAYGGGVSAPSENKAWYFSGMTSPSGGEIKHPRTDGSTTPQNISNFLIEVDMEVQSNEVWTNKTLEDVKGRANPEVVWVPVGEQGILVVLGGVVYPHWVTGSQQSEDAEASEEESPEFMQNIDIYDIAGDKWYKQQTEGGPGARTRGCAVVATASDASSFNIYYYGGFDGINPQDDFHDDVWVLSLPSFTWTQLNKGKSDHGRAGHRCVMPYPDQMLVVGGYTPMRSGPRSCLDGGVLQFFNLTSGDWMESYHPSDHSDYGVPDLVVEKIGGDATGGATRNSPSPDGWTDDDLADVFGQEYNISKIETFYPYPAIESSTGRPEVPGDDDGEDGGGGGGGGGGLPSWVAPVLGVVLGLMVLTGALVVFFLWRRRKIFQSSQGAGSSDASTEDPGKRIRQWMRGQQPSQQPIEKAPTVTTSEETAAASPEMASVSGLKTDPYPSPPLAAVMFHETEGNPIAELPDTSPPAHELSDAALTPDEIHERHASLARPGSLSNPSHSSFTGFGGNATTTAAEGLVEAPAGVVIPVETSQTESPVDYRLSDPGHMRSLSETLASTTAVEAPDGQRREREEDRKAAIAARRQSDQVSETPVSPPTTGDVPGEDYLTARAALVSPVVKQSVFRESEEDMEKK